MSNFGLTESDIEAIIAVLKNEGGVEEAVIFGSRAKGNYKNGSDVDIALKGKDVTYSLALHIGSVLNEETLMPYRFDVLNYHTIQNTDLVEHINRVGRVIYTNLSNYQIKTRV